MREEIVSKPVAGFDDFEDCVSHFEGDPDVDDAEALCGFLEQEGDALEDPDADEVLTNLSVEYVSAVDDPAQPSEWLIAKDTDEHDWAVTSLVLLSKGTDEKQVAFAPVLVPGEADRQGDVVPPHEIERAAWDYLKHYRKVDSDHDLLEGAGVPVESFTLKDSATFDKPDGAESREYPQGTWVLGIEFDDETWGRVKDGDLRGLSIYGGAAPIDVDDLLEGSPSDDSTAKQIHMNTLSKADSGEVEAFRSVVDEFFEEHGGDPESVTVGDLLKWIDEAVEADGESPDGDGDFSENLKSVADAVDELRERIEKIEDEAGVADRFNDRMTDDGGNERAEPRRKAVKEQIDAADGDGVSSVDYSGITDDGGDGDSSSSTSGTRTSTANSRMKEMGDD